MKRWRQDEDAWMNSKYENICENEGAHPVHRSPVGVIFSHCRSGKHFRLNWRDAE